MLDRNNVGEIPIPCNDTRQKMSLILEKIPRWKTYFRKTVVQQKIQLFEEQKKESTLKKESINTWVQTSSSMLKA